MATKYSILKILLCRHIYEKVGTVPIKTYFDHDGNKVGVFVCMCTKCKNVKKIKFY